MVTPEPKMDRPDLKLVDPEHQDRCGAPTNDGSPCERPTDGDLCWQHDGSPGNSADVPPQLGEYGREEWRRRVDELASAGVLEEVDLGLLESACEMYEESRRCQEAVAKHGHLVKGRNGVKKNPASAKHIKYRKEYRLCLKELRAMVKEATPKLDDDEFDPLADF